MCHHTHAKQKTTLYSWFFLPIFLGVLRVEILLLFLLGKHLYPLSTTPTPGPYILTFKGKFR